MPHGKESGCLAATDPCPAVSEKSKQAACNVKTFPLLQPLLGMLHSKTAVPAPLLGVAGPHSLPLQHYVRDRSCAPVACAHDATLVPFAPVLRPRGTLACAFICAS